MDITAWTPSVVAVGALGYVWWEIRKGSSSLKKKLYKEDGTTIFIPRTECDKKQLLICAKIAEVKDILKEMDRSRDETRREMSGILRENAEFMGKVNEHLERE